MFSANQKPFVICTSVTSFALVLQVCSRETEELTPFSANQNRVIFSCISLVLKNCEYCILSEVCMINSTVSPQM